MEEYCTNGRACRHAQLVRYLGEQFEGQCKSNCDNCRRRAGHNSHSDWYTQVRWCWQAGPAAAAQ